jgi:hypothetical protein
MPLLQGSVQKNKLVNKTEGRFGLFEKSWAAAAKKIILLNFKAQLTIALFQIVWHLWSLFNYQQPNFKKKEIQHQI